MGNRHGRIIGVLSLCIVWATAAGARAQASQDESGAMSKADRDRIEGLACPAVDVRFTTATDKKAHPVPEPAAAKALVFVVRPTNMGNKVQTKLAVDKQWTGVNRGNNYFFFELDPGVHYFCSKAENTSVLAITVEAGRTYYLQQKVKMGLMKARNELVQIAEADGKKGLSKTHPSSWTEKK